MKNKPNLLLTIFFWLFPAAMITLMTGLIYVTVQQSYRQGANDPQIQMAEDAARSLSGGSLPTLIVGNTAAMDMKESLATFIIVYDSTGRVLESSAHLDGQTPVPPSGVFDYVRTHEEERLTWEPAKDVRIAAVITKYTNSTNGSGFVLVGRSLREVEKREEALSRMAIIIWIMGLIISFFGIYLLVNKILISHRE